MKNKHNLFKGIPNELKLMLQAQIEGNGNYCTEPVLRYLTDHMYESESFLYGTSHQDILKQIDLSLEVCLFPVEFHDEMWNSNQNLICKVLTRAEELLQKIGPSDLEEGYRTPYDHHYWFNTVAYAQRLNLYFCILYCFSQEWEKLPQRLNKLLIDSERNVREMIQHKDAEKYASQDDWADFHYAGVDMDGWELINWVAKEYLPNSMARKMFAQVYEAYAINLSKMLKRLQTGSTAYKACTQLCRKAENNLQQLYDLILEEVTDCLEDSGNEAQSLLHDKKMYEELYDKSRERYKKVCLEVSGFPETMYEELDDEELPFF